MKITTDSYAVYDVIQEELEKRWTELDLLVQTLPFNGEGVLKRSDVVNLLYKNFTRDILIKLKSKENNLEAV